MRLRSLLFVPGDRPDQMHKATTSGADALILDLEDSVALLRKDAARSAVGEFLRHAARPLPMFVRVNPLASELLDDDLSALSDAQPDGVVLPKADGAESVRELDRRMSSNNLSLFPILPISPETPAAIFRMGEFASVSHRLAGLTWGAEDLSTAAGATAARTNDGSFLAPYAMVRSITLFAATAAQVPPIDTVFPAYCDHEGLSLYARCGARDGYMGMMAIHPGQVTIINAAFTPSLESIARAHRVIEAFSNNPKAGVLSIDGKMYDAPHLKNAYRILAQSDVEKPAFKQ